MQALFYGRGSSYALSATDRGLYFVLKPRYFHSAICALPYLVGTYPTNCVRLELSVESQVPVPSVGDGGPSCRGHEDLSRAQKRCKCFFKLEKRISLVTKDALISKIIGMLGLGPVIKRVGLKLIMTTWAINEGWVFGIPRNSLVNQSTKQERDSFGIIWADGEWPEV
ncbi:hypothetical protein BHM03_00043875 [Ensete ventricosum]|nr:hypothetical protein BHM03_00043875 [Ensete ventricosum]